MSIMQQLLGNGSVPVYIKVQASLILSITYLGALAYAGVYAANHHWGLDGLPAAVGIIIGTGASFALQIFNVHVTQTVQEASHASTPPA